MYKWKIELRIDQIKDSKAAKEKKARLHLKANVPSGSKGAAALLEFEAKARGFPETVEKGRGSLGHTVNQGLKHDITNRAR